MPGRSRANPSIAGILRPPEPSVRGAPHRTRRWSPRSAPMSRFAALLRAANLRVVRPIQLLRSPAHRKPERKRWSIYGEKSGRPDLNRDNGIMLGENPSVYGLSGALRSRQVFSNWNLERNLHQKAPRQHGASAFRSKGKLADAGVPTARSAANRAHRGIRSVRSGVSLPGIDPQSMEGGAGDPFQPAKGPLGDGRRVCAWWQRVRSGCECRTASTASGQPARGPDYVRSSWWRSRRRLAA